MRHDRCAAGHGGRHALLAPLLAAWVTATWGIDARAGDAAAGKSKARACLACHALDGRSMRPDAPHLSGQPERYLADQLEKYRSGARVDPTMNVVAKGLSDADIGDLSAWYASISIAVEPPP